jgi:hypothetical protein
VIHDTTGGFTLVLEAKFSDNTCSWAEENDFGAPSPLLGFARVQCCCTNCYVVLELRVV